MAENINIAGRLHSTATGNVVAGANEIYDDTKGKKQSVVNQETDTALDDRYTKAETYNKTELNNMITTPNQEFVSVVATDQTTAATDVLPATGEADTIYRVGNWDGTQYNDSVFSEYAWNGSAYVKLSTKSQVGEVYDISANHAGATYADLSAALGVDGANIPQSLRKGGMSVKFVLTSDNNYAQFRCKTQSFSTNPEDWYFESKDTLVENPEYIKAIRDRAGHLLGWIRKSDGGIDWAVGVPKPVREYVAAEIAKILDGSESTDIDGINKIIAFLDNFSTSDTLEELLATKVDKEEGKSLIPTQFIQEVDNPEFIEAKTDKGGYLTEGTKTDGSKYFGHNVKVEKELSAKKINIDGKEISPAATVDVTSIINDSEERLEIKEDNEKKIISYRDKRGILHEEAGIETNELILSQQGLAGLQNDFKESGFLPRRVSTPYNMPKYGVVNIKQETFYLSADGWDSYAEDVELRQLYDDTAANADKFVVISRFYTKNNVPLLFFAASKVNGLVGTASVTKVNGVCYYTDTLAYNNLTDKYSVLDYSMVATVAEEPAEQKSVNVEIAVKEVTDVPPYNAWAVNKKDEHHCIVDINFGYYLTKTNVAVGVKYQGSSTIKNKKRNFRFTFYKNNTFAKKNKIKIGELLRLSGYNLKANWTDDTRTKEIILYRLILSVWNNRPITDRFPWDKQYGYFTGATGIINGFNMRTNIGGTFYGLHTFGLKKDEKNYMLDGTDESGIFVCGSRRDATCWTTSTAADWEDEMMDEMSQDTADALNVFLNFINNRLYKGSDNNEYFNTALTYFIGDTSYSYNEVTVKDGKVVLASDTSIEIENIYVTSTLNPAEGSVTAEYTSDMAYRGSDGNLYILSELTEIDGVFYVTSTLGDDNPVTATYLDHHIYVGSDNNRYLFSETTMIDGVRYVTNLIIWETTESSVSAELIPFDKENAPERMDILGWLDYFICMQTGEMWDSICRNLILFSQSDKKKFYPYFYDVDLSLRNNYDDDIFDLAYNIVNGVKVMNDMSLWSNLKDMYWDEIINRYSELRKTVLTIDNVKAIYHDVIDEVPESDFVAESERWGVNVSKDAFTEIIAMLEKRFVWLDTEYFI